MVILSSHKKAVQPENTHLLSKWKYHCMADLLFAGYDSVVLPILN